MMQKPGIITKLQNATSLITEVTTEIENKNWVVAVLTVYLLHHGGRVEVGRIPNFESPEITLKPILALIEAKQLFVQCDFERLTLYMKSSEGLIQLETFEQLQQLIAATAPEKPL